MMAAYCCEPFPEPSSLGWCLTPVKRMTQMRSVLCCSRSVHRRLHRWGYRLSLGDGHHWNSWHFVCSSLFLPQESTRSRRKNCKSHAPKSPVQIFINTQICRICGCFITFTYTGWKSQACRWQHSWQVAEQEGKFRSSWHGSVQDWVFEGG